MKNIANIKSIQKKCELIARESEVMQEFDLAGSYGNILPQTITNYSKKYMEGLTELRNQLNDYLQDC